MLAAVIAALSQSQMEGRSVACVPAQAAVLPRCDLLSEGNLLHAQAGRPVESASCHLLLLDVRMVLLQVDLCKVGGV